MIQTPETGPLDRTLDSYLSEKSRELLAEACGLLDVAASRRSTARRLEEPIRAWETRTRVHPLKGTHWEKSLKKLVVDLTAAGKAYRRIYDAETQAVPLLNACIDGLRNAPSETEERLPREVLGMLASSTRMRTDALAAIERTLAVSSQIRAFTTSSTPHDVLSLLDDRRRAIAESEACRSRADALEERALRLETERIEDMESAAMKALGGEDDLGSVRHANPGSRPATFGDHEWRTWLRFLEDDVSIVPKPHTADTVSPGVKPGSDAVRGAAAQGGRIDDEARDQAIARLRDAKTRLVEATEDWDRALAEVARLTSPVDASTS